MNERELMPGMTLENIARACQGRYIGDKKLLSRLISGAVTDSRQVTEGYLFIPIKGERVMDMILYHRYLPREHLLSYQKRNWKIRQDHIFWWSHQLRQ